jgi:uncharacterized BrkB/YihY/UPF0761 family membrane protein
VQALLAGARNPASGLIATLVASVLLLVSLVISAVLAMFERYAGEVWGGSYEVLATTTSVISFAVIAGLFAVIYKTLPDAPLSWRDVWIGAFFTAGLFSLGKYAIGLYLGNSGVASSFGAAGSLIALLLWVYYSAQIFFLGAEFTRQYALGFGSHGQDHHDHRRLHLAAPGRQPVPARGRLHRHPGRARPRCPGQAADRPRPTWSSATSTCR